MPETIRNQMRECLDRELEIIGAGEPIEAPNSNHRLKIFILRDERGAVQAVWRRMGPQGEHDVDDVLAVLDVTLQSDEYLVAQCLQEFFDEEIPTDDNGGVDPNWPVDPDTLAETHEEAWDRHCVQSIDEWIDDALAQMRAERPPSS